MEIPVIAAAATDLASALDGVGACAADFYNPPCVSHQPITRAATSLLHRNLKRFYAAAARGEGCYIIDDQGRRWLDFAGSAAVNFIGHGSQRVAEAIARQLSSLEFAHSSQFTTDVAEDLAAELLEFAGPAFAGGRVFFTSGGSEAVETALKLARQYHVESGQPKRFQIISRHQSYHGATLGALAASGNRRRRKIYLPLVREGDAFPHIGTPYCYRCPYRCQDCAAKYAKELELAVVESHGAAAAFIAEPVSGATLGAAVPPEDYWRRVREICDSAGLLLIADEVMTGCGRTGANLALDHWDVTADIVVLAKGLSSGYLPLGAVIANSRVVAALESGSGAILHGFTYNAHPVCVAAGREVLRIIREQDLAQRASQSHGGPGAVMAHHLPQLLRCHSVGDVRGIGLLWGVEFVADRETRAPFPPEIEFADRVAAAAARRGILTYPMQGCADGASGDHLLIAPPAIITADQIEDAVNRLQAAIVETETETRKESGS